jgi:hypothetical protein
MEIRSDLPGDFVRGEERIKVRDFPVIMIVASVPWMKTEPY